MRLADTEVKVFKLIAYIELLRKGLSISPKEDDIDFIDKDKLNRFYHKLGNIRYELKKMIGHDFVTDSYIVKEEDYIKLNRQRKVTMKKYRVVNLLSGLIEVVIARSTWEALRKGRRIFATSMVRTIQ